jgi:hypothetical protein
MVSFKSLFTNFSTAKDLGFIDINKFSQNKDLPEFDENHNPYDGERSLSKGDLSGAVTPIQTANKYISFSPYRGNKPQGDVIINPFSGLHLLHKGIDSAGGTPLKYVEKRVDSYPHYDAMNYESNSNDYKDNIKQEYIEFGDEGLSAMWSNEPARVTKAQKQNSFDEQYPKGRKPYVPLHRYESYENYEDKHSQENEIFTPTPFKPEVNKFSRPPEDDDKIAPVRIPKPANLIVKKESSKRESASKYNPQDYGTKYL